MKNTNNGTPNKEKKVVWLGEITPAMENTHRYPTEEEIERMLEQAEEDDPD